MPGDKKYRPAWIRLSGIGIEYVAAVAGFGLVGYWIDRHYKTDPWGVVIGAALGLVGATYNLVRESLAAFKDVGDEDRDEDRPAQP